MRKNKKIQYCRNCDKTVSMEDKQEVQDCPKCGMPIKPCDICNMSDNLNPDWGGCRKDCPHEIDYKEKYRKWLKEQ